MVLQVAQGVGVAPPDLDGLERLLRDGPHQDPVAQRGVARHLAHPRALPGKPYQAVARLRLEQKAGLLLPLVAGGFLEGAGAALAPKGELLQQVLQLLVAILPLQRKRRRLPGPPLGIERDRFPDRAIVAVEVLCLILRRVESLGAPGSPGEGNGADEAKQKEGDFFHAMKLQLKAKLYYYDWQSNIGNVQHWSY